MPPADGAPATPAASSTPPATAPASATQAASSAPATNSGPAVSLASVPTSALAAELAERNAKAQAAAQAENMAKIAPLVDLFSDAKSYTLTEIVTLLRQNVTSIVEATENAEGHSPFKVHLDGFLTVASSAQNVVKAYIAANTAPVVSPTSP